MHALVNGLLVTLESEDSQILAGWRPLFDLEIGAAGAVSRGEPAITVRATLAQSLPPSPDRQPSYSRTTVAGQRPLAYFAGPPSGVLDLVRPARIEFDFAGSEARILLTPQVLDTGNLEDITSIALAPLLRRRGVFMEHAFSIARGDTAVLLAGPSGSGKTTLGLALTQTGWGYLGNDMALLQDIDADVHAFPAPGAINLDADSLALVPGLQDRLPSLGVRLPAPGKQSIARHALLTAADFGQPASVKTIIFPALTVDSDWSLREVKSAVGLARLIAESVDQWDRDTYASHLDLLTALSSQARFFDLNLPIDRPEILRRPAQLLAAAITP